MNFGTKVVFHYLFYQLKSKLYRYKNEFWHKACFSLLVLSVRNSNCSTSHIPNRQLKFKSLQNTHSRDVWVQLQIKKYYITIYQLNCSRVNIGTVEPTGAKSQPVTSQRYLKSKDSNRILGIYSFRDLLAGTKFEMIKIFRVKTTEERQKNCKIRPFLAKKKEQNSCKFTKI